MKLSEFNKTMRHLRESVSLTRKELADEIGVCHTQVASWETSSKSIFPGHLIILSDYFNVSIDEIIRGKTRIGSINFMSLRNKANMTPSEMANKLDISENQLKKIEDGVQDPSILVLIKLSEICNTSIDDILKKTI